MVRAIGQELLQQIAVGRMKFDTVETGVDRKGRRTPELVDYARDSVGVQRPGHHLLDFHDIAGRISDRGVLARLDRRRRDRHRTVDIGGMRLPPRVPELHEYASAFRMHRVGHAANHAREHCCIGPAHRRTQRRAATPSSHP